MNRAVFDVESYLAGLIAGDGHIEGKTNRVVISTNNSLFKLVVCDFLNSLGLKTSIVFDSKGGNVWKISVYSEAFQKEKISL
ncbi:hypothetical protein HZC09_04530 [Candidatus Micrarchaeota archaeon]|nr:hypothetical protein [Candidatus Micrarchaeota archaeon]